MEGLLDNSNITYLDENLVKTTGNQYISGSLQFLKKIVAENLNVTESINDLPVDELCSCSDNFCLEKLSFDKLFVGQMEVLGNVNAKQTNFDIDEYKRRTIRLNEPQHIKFPINVLNAHILNFESENWNGVGFNKFLVDIELYKRIIEEKLSTGKLKVKRENLLY